MSLFANYATGVGFRLELTKAQIRLLNSLVLDRNDMVSLKLNWSPVTALSLQGKGLITIDENGFYLTPAGKATIKLLRLAKCLKRNSGKKILP